MIPLEQLKFIETIAPIVQKYCKERGYKFASPIIAQATVESFKGQGLSLLASKYFNFFGMKCGSSWTGKSVNLSTKEEYQKGVLSDIKANFRVYDDYDSAIRGYFDFINTKRYANLKNATSPQDYLEKIKADGYATSSTYVSTNMKRITMYNLTQYDTFNPVQPSAVPTIKGYQVGKVYTLQSNMYVRQTPGGEKIKFDSFTQDAKRHGHFDNEGNGILNSGTRVTCKEVVNKDKQIWIHIPSGWVCAVGEKTYII